MQRDFLQEFRNRMKAIDAGKPRYEEFGPVADLPARMGERRPTGKRYNVHKRSLPVGVPPLDRIVFYNVSKREAELLVDKFLKTKCYDDEVRETKTIVYYDIVPVNAIPRERSIYYNPGPITKEEGSEPEVAKLEIVRDPEWIG